MPTNVKIHCSRRPASPHSIVEQDPAEAAFADICWTHNLHISLEAQSHVLCKCLGMQRVVRQTPVHVRPM